VAGPSESLRKRYSQEKEPKRWKCISPPELEAKLVRSAAQQGRNPDDLVQDVVTRYFDEEARFVEGVRRGEEALQRGDYLTHEQVGRRLDRFLRP
jgi:predicted transcriptional regulator